MLEPLLELDPGLTLPDGTRLAELPGARWRDQPVERVGPVRRPSAGGGGVSSRLPPSAGGLQSAVDPMAPGTLVDMEEMLELASFRGNDDPSLVAAALACRACLSGDVDWSLLIDDFDAEAICRCRACGYARRCR